MGFQPGLRGNLCGLSDLFCIAHDHHTKLLALCEEPENHRPQQRANLFSSEHHRPRLLGEDLDPPMLYGRVELVGNRIIRPLCRLRLHHGTSCYSRTAGYLRGVVDVPSWPENGHVDGHGQANWQTRRTRTQAVLRCSRRYDTHLDCYYSHYLHVV